MKNYLKLLIWIPVLLFVACQEEFQLEEAPPAAEDASFASTEGTNGPNYMVFTNDSRGFIKKWDFGNGAFGEGDKVTAYFPFAGDYEVVLTVYTAGGSVSASRTVSIAETDPEICNVEVLQLLTGGCSQPEGKTWVIDAARKGNLGLGPVTSMTAEWYEAGANEKVGGGLYDDEYTFYLNNFVYKQETNGDVFVRTEHAADFPGAVDSGVGDLVAPYEAPGEMNFALTEGATGEQYINFTEGGFMGFATGVSAYQILSITENELYVRFKDTKNPDFAWYHRLIPKGYEPIVAGFTYTVNGTEVTFTNTSANATGYSWDFGDGNTSTEENPVHTYAADGNYDVTLTASGSGENAQNTQTITIAASLVELPLTFESQEPVFSTFGGSAYQYVDNPDASGANTSGRVLETTHGNESWAGLFVDLTEPLDLAATTTLSLKVWAPQTGTFRLKLENTDDAADFIEVDQTVDVASAWVDIDFDISAAAGKTYRRVVIFPGWNVPNAGTFYVDDIRQKVSLPLTFESATPAFEVFGGSSHAVIDNPHSGGINTSAKVLETVHGGETWAGLFTDLSDPLNISASSTITLKVWAPATGTFRLKLENINDSGDFIELDQPVDTASEWITLSFDISAAVGKNYHRVVIFPGWSVASAGTFYVDDIQLTE